MKRSRIFKSSIVGIGASFFVGCAVAPGEPEVNVQQQALLDGAELIRVAKLPDLDLEAFQEALLPGSIANDRGIRLGSIGSDIFRKQGDKGNTFWMTTDRGPNGQPGGRRTFAVPDFAPMIVQVQAMGERIEILKALPLVGSDDVPVSGLPNLSTDEVAYNFDATVVLGLNRNGVDPEGLVRTDEGDFWLVEEYRPSLLHVDSTGQVLERIVPVGAGLTGTSYPVTETLPAIFSKRRANRGFEGLALNADETTLVAAMQSPLEHPTKTIGRASRNVRFARIDAVTQQLTGEFVYQMDEVCSFLGLPAACGVAPGDMKVSGLASLPGDKLLVLERTDDVAKIYQVDLAAATNLLGTQWDATATSPALEQLTDFAAAGVAPLAKTLIVDLSTLADVPKKIEGVTVINPETLAVSADNDFGLVDETTYDAAGNLANDTGVQSQILYVRLPVELPH